MPEGDPLSCLAMLGFCYCLSYYLQVYAGDVIAPCYVDNIQILSDRASALNHGIGILQVFLRAWDLDLDPNKSYAWATQASDRRTLKFFGHQVRHAAQDLGAQMSYSKLSRKQVFSARLDAASSYWKTLRLSVATPWHKLLAIRSAVWPKILHGCQNRLISHSDLSFLRSRAMYALQWNRAGASPHVRWSLMQVPDLDPEFYQLWARLSTFWRMVRSFPLIQSLWADFLMNLPVPGQGPLHAVWQVLELLDWFIDHQMQLWIHDHSWNFAFISLAELHLLAVEDWRQRVCTRIAHRADFQGLPSIDASVSFSVSFPDSRLVGLLGTIQDGTFCSSFQFSKFSEEHSGFCSKCQQEDTLEHRALVCSRFASVRARYARNVSEWTSLPTAFTHHGLVPQNPFLWHHWISLNALPDVRATFFVQPRPGLLRHIFVDGSCTRPTSPRFALASWAVVSMHPREVIAGGPVHGLIQSNDRAEVMALHSAALWALQSGEVICAHSDSMYALDGFSFLQLHKYVPAKWCNSDLWDAVLATLLQLDSSTFTCQKVAAHQDLLQASCPEEEFLWTGNHFADRTARRYNELRSSCLMDNYNQLLAYDTRMRYRVRTQLCFLVDLADVNFQDAPLPFDPEDELIAGLAESLVPNESQIAAQIFDFELMPTTDEFPLVFVQTLVQWVAGLDIVATYQRPVTIVELVAGFQLDVGLELPIPFEVNGVRGFRQCSDVVGGGLFRSTLATAVAVFTRALEFLFQKLGIHVTWTTAARPSASILRPLKALVIGWPTDYISRIDGKIVSWCGNRPIRRANDLARPW